MTEIRILPEVISNKIAAGEVVERPASVVKELLENALDADARKIRVEIEKGGRALIRVVDDGHGMGKDDTLLAIERYATSKIHHDDDLFAIKTLGFRGEALPSIAAVSKFTLESRPADVESGTRVEIHGGKLVHIKAAGMPPGTMVTVRQLFYNTPARRKFLKTINTEMGHIADTVAHMSLGRPEVQFRLIHNRRVVKEWPAVKEPLVRVIQVLGNAVKGKLQPLGASDGDMTVTGHVALPEISRSTARGVYTYVNGRFVKDKVLRHAVYEGFSGRLMKGTYPVGVIRFKLPADGVDVNVHPTKHEVRFRQPKRVHDLITVAVTAALKAGEKPIWSTRLQAEETTPPKGVSETPAIFKRVAKTIKTGLDRIDLPPTEPPLNSYRLNPHADQTHISPTAAEQTSLTEADPGVDLRIIGQLRNTYIVCESPKGLLLLDQHAAHERIRYEVFKKGVDGAKIPRQQLLMPETIELSFTETEILIQILSDLNRMGYEIEPFGGNTFIIKSVPAILGQVATEPIIKTMVEKMAQVGIATNKDAAVNEMITTAACHEALRAKERLHNEEMRQLIAQLMRCDTPAHCPHGRPTWIQWPISKLEKDFGRVV